MAYNYKSIESFIAKVNKEAEEAAQKIFDKYECELLKRVQAQLKDGDIVHISMGSASIENRYGKDVGGNLKVTIVQTQYWQRNVCAGLNLPYKFNKTEIIKKD